MCLAIPAKIIKMIGDDRALVDVGGVQREISISLLENAQENEYVIVHVGYAISKLDEKEAEKTLKLFEEMMVESNEIY